MKTYLTIALFVVAGVGLTVLFSLSELGLLAGNGSTLDDPLFRPSEKVTPVSGTPSVAKSSQTAEPAADSAADSATAPLPSAVVEEREYDFGRAKNHTRGHRHAFQIRNEGEGPLRFSGSDVSCKKCTFVDELPKRDILPGETAEVVVRWDIESLEEVFRQSATVFTNDPQRPRIRFVIVGKVLHPLRVEPDEVILNSVPPGEITTVKVRLFAFFSDQLQVSNLRLLDAEAAEFYEVTFAPIPSDELVPDALSGVELTITIKSGLPLGVFRQKIVLHPNLEDVPEVEVPIYGKVVSDISILGRDWFDERGIVRFGAVNRAKGIKRTLKVLVRGPRQEGLVFEAPQVSPDAMKVTLGEITKINKGATTQVPVHIEIPAGLPPMNHMEDDNMGVIILPTNSPAFGKIKIQVQFAVEG